MSFCSNSIQHPSEEKFRIIRVENKNFNAKVWSLPEAQQFLMVWGWVEVSITKLISLIIIGYLYCTFSI
jgi:hypothetical protein